MVRMTCLFRFFRIKPEMLGGGGVFFYAVKRVPNGALCRDQATPVFKVVF